MHCIAKQRQEGSTVRTDRFRLKVTFETSVLGTQTQKDIASRYIQEKAKAAGLDVQDEDETLPEMLDRGTSVFHKLSDGTPILYDYMVKGFLKDVALTFNGKLCGIRNARSKVENFVFVTPRRIVLNVPNGSETGYCERPMRNTTAIGQPVSLIRSEELPAGTNFECELEVLPGEINEEYLREILSYGTRRGLGQWRTGGHGRFKFELEKLT